MMIGDLAAATGLTVDTLRWYEKIGLVPVPPRDHGGRRVYPPEIFAWIGFLGRLKATGMSIAEMRDYARLRAAGDRTTTARRLLLERHRARVLADITSLTDSLAVLDGKIDTYRRQEAAASCGPTEGHRP